MRIRLFYGWYIVAAGLVLTAYHSAIFIYGFTAFVNPIITTFAWSYTQISLATSLRGLESGVFNPIWGVLVDRYSPRKLMLLGVVVTALGIFCLSRTTNLAMYYGGFLIMGLASSLAVGILPTAVITRWFRKDIGKANGVFFMGLGIGGVMVPLVVKAIDSFGWQTTLMFSAIGFLALGVPLSLVFRSRPQDYGLVPDGKASEAARGSKPVPFYDFSTGVKEVFKMRAFWYINIVSLFQMSVLGILTLYMIPYMTSLGHDRSSAGMVVMLYTLISLTGRIPLGMLADVFKKTFIVALTIVMMGVGLFLFWLIDGNSPFWLTLLFAIIFGLGIGGIMPLRPPLLAEYFGTRNFGTIFGITSIFNTIAMVVAPPVAGWFFDTYGDYKSVWLALIGFAVVSLILMLTMPAPPGKTKQVTS